MAWAPDYATTGELAAFARIGDSADDAQLALAVAAAACQSFAGMPRTWH